MLVVLFGASFITFGMMFLTPGDPAYIILDTQMGPGKEPSQAALQEFRNAHGLNEPFLVQYGRWIWNVLHGDFGVSYWQQNAVSGIIAKRIPQTAELAIAGTIVSLVISLPAGIISAVHKGELPDYISQIAALIGVAMPNFWLAYLLIIVFSLHLDLLPVSGFGTLQHLILPALTLGTGMAAIVTRLTRSAMLEVLDEDYIRTARSKGLRERIIVYKHALRNALIPVVTIVGLQFGYLLNGAVIAEIVFSRPGLGNLLIESIFQRDYPIVRGLVLLIAAMFVMINFLVDVTYRYIDPRIQLEGREQ